MKTNKEILETVKELAKKKGFSQNEVARRTGFPKSSISRYFNETRELPLNKLSNFAKALEVPTEYLLGVAPVEDKVYFDEISEKEYYDKIKLYFSDLFSEFGYIVTDKTESGIDEVEITHTDSDIAFYFESSDYYSALDTAYDYLFKIKKINTIIYQTHSDLKVVEAVLKTILARADSNLDIPYPEYSPDYFLLQYNTNLSAGSFMELLAQDSQNTVPVPIKLQSKKRRLHAFKVNGDSMNNIFVDGSIVVIEDTFNNAIKIKDNSIVVAFYNGEATIKRFFDFGEYILLAPDSKNKSFMSIKISKEEDFTILGKVIWFISPEDVMEKLGEI